MLREAVQRLDPKLKGPKDAKGNRDMIRRATKREGADLEEWASVITAQYESVKGDPSAWRFLSLSTITRPANWARLRDAPAPQAPATRSAVGYTADGENLMTIDYDIYGQP